MLFCSVTILKEVVGGMFKKSKPQTKDVEQVLGIVMTVFNGINAESKEMFSPSDRKMFLSHLAALLENEAKLINSPVGDLIKGGEPDA